MPDDDFSRVVQRVTAYELKQQVERMEEHLRRQDESIAKLLASQAKLDGQVGILLATYERVSAQSSAADVEVRKTDQLAVIRERQMQARFGRRAKLSLVTGMTGLLAAATTVLADRCGG